MESKTFHCRVRRASVEFREQSFRKPLLLSSGPITEITEARATVEIEMADGVRATGRGSIYLSDLWAWPEPSLTHEQRDAILRKLCEEIAGSLPEWCGEPAHPLENGLRLHHHACAEQDPPVLARAMCASPFDAAIHDAAGIAAGCSAFDFYKTDAAIPSADAFFPGTGAVRAIRQCLVGSPVVKLPAWWIVGAKDDLENDVRPAVTASGIHCFKLKILGKDSAADAARTAEVYRAASSWGLRDIRITVDSNEANPDAASVLEYLHNLKAGCPEAFDALMYLEQPTGRDITKHAFDWREVSQIKPVMLDEGLTDLNLLPLAKQQGWSGLALKTCKGHSFALTAAAWAKGNGMLLSLQDLTNPGLSAMHAFLFAAHIPMLNGVELNSPQYTPAANAEWLPRLAGLFEPKDGLHHLSEVTTCGLGSEL